MHELVVGEVSGQNKIAKPWDTLIQVNLYLIQKTIFHKYY